MCSGVLKFGDETVFSTWNLLEPFSVNDATAAAKKTQRSGYFVCSRALHLSPPNFGGLA